MNPQCMHTSPLAIRGFTLLEVLAAAIVMVLVLTLLLSVSGGTMKNTRLCNRTLNTTAHARAILDVLESDLANVVPERGLTVYGSQTTESSANSMLAFLAQGRGPTAASRFMAVCYQHSSDGTIHRFSNSALWNHDNLETRILGALSSGTYSAIGKGILRFSACAILDDGTTVAFTDSSSGNTWKTNVNSGGSSSFFGMNLSDPNARRVRGLMVGLVAVDEQSFQLLQKTGKLDQAIAAFSAPSMRGSALVNTPNDWEALLANHNNENLNTLPASVIAGVQVFQNTFYFH